MLLKIFLKVWHELIKSEFFISDLKCLLKSTGDELSRRLKSATMVPTLHTVLWSPPFYLHSYCSVSMILVLSLSISSGLVLIGFRKFKVYFALCFIKAFMWIMSFSAFLILGIFLVLNYSRWRWCYYCSHIVIILNIFLTVKVCLLLREG